MHGQNGGPRSDVRSGFTSLAVKLVGGSVMALARAGTTRRIQRLRNYALPFGPCSADSIRQLRAC